MRKRSQQAFDEFDQAAKDWGWAQYVGIGSYVKQSERHYRETKEALLKRIRHLENKLNKAGVKFV